MKILILNWKDIENPQRGGAEIIVYELAKRLVADGHNVVWFCRHSTGLPRTQEIDGIKIVRFGNIVGMYIFAPVYYWTGIKKPDLVIDMSNTIFWMTPVWALFSRKIAYLNQLAMEVFDYEYSRTIGSIGKAIERLQYFFYKRMHFVCYSHSTKDDLIIMGIKSENIKTFSLGLDTKRYIPGPKSKTPLFIVVTRLVRMKRVELVIRAHNIVTSKYPKARLVIVGNGYDMDRLQRIVSDLNLGNSVTFIDKNNWYFGKNVKDQKVKLMQMAWAHILPSVKEGWGMVVTESAACGTPSIVSNVTGLRDSVINGKTGIVLSKDPTPDELSDAMIRIIKDGKLRTQMSKESLKWAGKFSWEKSYKEFKNIIFNVK